MRRRVTAGGAAAGEEPLLAGKAAGGAADRHEKAAAVWAGFYAAVDLGAAVIAEKAGLFFARLFFQSYAV